MQGNLFVVNFHVHGTLSEDIVARYTLPINATLIRIDTNSTADAEGSMIVGTAADTDGYVKSFTPGHNATLVTINRGDFDGALNTDTAECPHIAAETTILITYTHNDSNTNVDIALTFLEG
jgi:hypothetical protein